MIKWIKAAKAKRKVKAYIYTLLADIIDGKGTLLTTSFEIIKSFEGMTGDELQKAFITKIAELVHNEKL